MAFTGREQTFLERTLDNPSAFFPPLSIGEFQKVTRVPANLAPEAVEQQLLSAMGDINDALTSTVEAWQSQGFVALADVATATGKPLAAFYFQAVYYRAKAWLMRDYQTFSRRDVAEDSTQEGESIYTACLVTSNRALRSLDGRHKHMSVELL